MSIATRQFLLFSHVERQKQHSEWRFTLQTSDGAELLSEHDTEPDAHGERLELLAVLRGLEAMDEPGEVAVYTSSRYVLQGLEYGLDEWRRNGWNWERFGQLMPVKNRDLWQRLDRARKVHEVSFRRWRIDSAHDEPRVVLNRRQLDSSGVPTPHFRPSPLWARPLRTVPPTLRNDWRGWVALQWTLFLQWLQAFPLRPHATV